MLEQHNSNTHKPHIIDQKGARLTLRLSCENAYSALATFAKPSKKSQYVSGASSQHSTSRTSASDNCVEERWREGWDEDECTLRALRLAWWASSSNEALGTDRSHKVAYLH